LTKNTQGNPEIVAINGEICDLLPNSDIAPPIKADREDDRRPSGQVREVVVTKTNQKIGRVADLQLTLN